MRRAVFIDRDGTLSEEIGYVTDLARFKLFPWTTAAIRKLNEAGIPVVLVTNQSGVARGYFTEELLRQVHDKLLEALARGGARLDAIYYCPHHPDASVPTYKQTCDCRKPGVGMLTRASRELELDLEHSFVVGDRYQDLQLAFQIGGRAVLVLTGYGQEEYTRQRHMWGRQPDHVAANLAAAVDWIISDLQPN